MNQYRIVDTTFPKNKEDLQQHILIILEDPATLHTVSIIGKNIYFHEASNTIMLFNENAQGKRGIVFQPLHGKEYYAMSV